MEEIKDLITLEEPVVEPRATQPDHFQQIPTEINGFKIPMPLYFYYIGTEKINQGNILVPPTDAVISVVYAPYLEKAELDVKNVAYDYTRFPVKGLSDAGNEVEIIAKRTELHRINSQTYQFIDKDLKEFAPYKIEGKNVGGARNWRNEGKCWQYPYHYSVIFDGISEPLEVRPHLCYNKTKAKVKVKTPVSSTGQYTLYVEQYKEDLQGVFEGQTSTSSLQLPLVSSAYTNYMSTNKAQLAASRFGTGASTGVGLASAAIGVASAMAAPVTGGTSLAIGAAVLGGATTAVSGFNAMNQSFAQERDLQQAPGSLKTLGSDLMFDLQNNLAIGRNSLNLYRIKTVEAYMTKLGDYFALYGYKQNKVMKPNTRNRYFYNYIKTGGVNITNKDGSGIPKEHFNKLKAIYDNGTTIWHISRGGVHVGDYSMDNYET